MTCRWWCQAWSLGWGNVCNGSFFILPSLLSLYALSWSSVRDLELPISPASSWACLNHVLAILVCLSVFWTWYALFCSEYMPYTVLVAEDLVVLSIESIFLLFSLIICYSTKSLSLQIQSKIMAWCISYLSTLSSSFLEFNAVICVTFTLCL